jgi:hypothetical protein
VFWDAHGELTGVDEIRGSRGEIQRRRRRNRQGMYEGK